MTAGLVAPSWPPDAFPLWWRCDDSRRSIPPIVRFSWLPTTGELRVGVQFRHLLQVRSHPAPFESWLRGFVFQRDRCLVIRTYYWPESPYDWFDASHRRLDLRVTRSFVKVVRPHVPKRTLIFDKANNKFLKERFAHLSMDW